MKNELQVFTNEEFGNVRVVTINGDGWLVGKEVVETLGYDLSTNRYGIYISKYVDEEDKLDCNSQSSFGIDYKELGQRGGILINESGLYSLVLNSKLPQAKRFKKWVTSEVLPTLRKTGGYVANDDLFLNTYLPFADETTKLMFKTTLETVRKQNELIKSQQVIIESQVKEIEHKEDMIIDLTKGIDIAEKRQRITQIVRYRAKGNYQERYNLLYREFNAKFHVDVQRRLKNGKENGTIKKSVNVMEYICSEKYLNMTNELYDLCVVVFEADFIELLEEWKDTINK